MKIAPIAVRTAPAIAALSPTESPPLPPLDELDVPEDVSVVVCAGEDCVGVSEVEAVGAGTLTTVDTELPLLPEFGSCVGKEETDDLR